MRESFPSDISSFLVVPSDLTAEERQELENIRRRKQELLADIQVGGHGGDACGVTGVLYKGLLVTSSS